MAKVLWSHQAEADLKLIDPAVRDQLVRNAEDTLRDIPPGTADFAEEGAHQGIMWRRGGTPEQGHLGLLWEEDDHGTQVWDYFFLYRSLGPEQFEVLAVVNTHQIASQWMQMSGEPSTS